MSFGGGNIKRWTQAWTDSGGHIDPVAGLVGVFNSKEEDKPVVPVVSQQVIDARNDPGTNTRQIVDRRKRGMIAMLGDQSKVGVLA